jgi:hypothetical protein
MMKIFMASGSLTRVMEVNEVHNEVDTIPFPGQRGYDDLRWVTLAGDAPRV